MTDLKAEAARVSQYLLEGTDAEGAAQSLALLKGELSTRLSREELDRLAQLNSLAAELPQPQTTPTIPVSIEVTIVIASARHC